MQGVSETNHVSSVHSVATVLYLYFMLPVMLLPMRNFPAHYYYYYYYYYGCDGLLNKALRGAHYVPFWQEIC
jgi:hypothetical protein